MTNPWITWAQQAAPKVTHRLAHTLPTDGYVEIKTANFINY